MTIIVLPADDEDIGNLFDISCSAFGSTEPAWSLFYPAFETEAGRKAGIERRLNSKRHDPHSFWHKAVESDSGSIVGYSVWTLYNDRMVTLPEDAPPDSAWPDPEDAEMAKYIMSHFSQQRSNVVASHGGNVLHMNHLAVSPHYQRQGIGGQLLAWGFRLADEMGLQAWVWSSAMGRGLYEKHGFLFQKERTIEVPERFATRKSFVYTFLIRPCQSVVE